MLLNHLWRPNAPQTGTLARAQPRAWTRRKTLTLAGFIAVAATPVLVPMILSLDDWYEFVKPTWAPSGAVFTRLWGAVTIMTGVAAFAAWRASRGERRRFALQLYGLHLLLNAAWYAVFFSAAPGVALLLAGVLAVAAALNTTVFADIRTRAGWLLAPYLVCVWYAFALNFAVIWSG